MYLHIYAVSAPNCGQYFYISITEYFIVFDIIFWDTSHLHSKYLTVYALCVFIYFQFQKHFYYPFLALHLTFSFTKSMKRSIILIKGNADGTDLWITMSNRVHSYILGIFTFLLVLFLAIFYHFLTNNNICGFKVTFFTCFFFFFVFVCQKYVYM